MRISGWGKNISCDSNIKIPSPKQAINHPYIQTPIIGRGLGRSYGDSAIAQNVLSSKYQNHFINFDEHSGLLTCQGGVSFDDIIQTFIPKGWFLPVTPGTKFVTVAGAIASDVHGKNHHIDGTFGKHVTSIKLCNEKGEVIDCDPEKNQDLFHATCGGMGLTGFILQATFQLIRISSSNIQQTTYKTKNLEETLRVFKDVQGSTYSVAWIDCLSTGKQLGRSLIMTGEHIKSGELYTKSNSKLAIPFEFPNIALNKFSIQAFNTLYYNKVLKKVSKQIVHLEPFFYPLDGINNWNNMYGKSGFIQYQFVIPFNAGLEGLTEILEEIAKSKLGSFLAVLKVTGEQNKNLLSFPMEGFTLALDFKVQDGLMALLPKLNKLVMKHQGRLYLAKDSNMPEDMFKKTYPNWEVFQEVRKKYQCLQGFNSMQATRLGL